ncbi:MAG TPA: 3-isopropylmalate dehydratase large subunit [Anaerolineae bacterium]|nr:3-isopropylmalate dehydratase large subunit [Anaerolineae bacterium]
MSMTLAQKILAAHSGRDRVEVGELIDVSVDMVLANDITAPLAIKEFARLGVERVFDPERIALVPDHFTPNKDIKSAEQCKVMREFARQHGITNYFEVGRAGIEHALLPELGLVLPGEVIVGADSHTCTYGALGAFATGVGSTDTAVAMATGRAWMRVPESMRLVYRGALKPWVGGKDLILHTIGLIGVDGALYQAIEFTGPSIDALPVDGRFTMANMAVEAGAKAGLFQVDAKTEAYLSARARRPYRAYAPDGTAEYAEAIEVDASAIQLQVSLPHLPSNTRPVGEVGDIEIQQVVIGSCTNGRWSDLLQAAWVLQRRKVHPDVRCIIIPATQQIYLQAVREGLAEIFVEAGAVLSTPTCGPCLGGHMGVLAAGERCVSTTNRNFVGRMGHPESEVYLAGPAVAAASAVLGVVAGPDRL